MVPRGALRRDVLHRTTVLNSWIGDGIWRRVSGIIASCHSAFRIWVRKRPASGLCRFCHTHQHCVDVHRAFAGVDEGCPVSAVSSRHQCPHHFGAKIWGPKTWDLKTWGTGALGRALCSAHKESRHASIQSAPSASCNSWSDNGVSKLQPSADADHERRATLERLKTRFGVRVP